MTQKPRRSPSSVRCRNQPLYATPDKELKLARKRVKELQHG
jgi:hypothetical protein